jgi:hypothetical protein
MQTYLQASKLLKTHVHILTQVNKNAKHIKAWVQPKLFMVLGRHDRNLRFSKSLSYLKIYYSCLTPIISCLLIINTMLPTH